MIVEQIVEKALQKAESAQAVMQVQEMSAVNFEFDRLKSAEASQRTDIKVKVIHNGRLGTSLTTDPHDIDGVVNRALETAEFGSVAHYEMPVSQPTHPVKTNDPAIRLLGMPEMIQLGQGMMDMIKSYNDEILTGANIGKNFVVNEFANSANAVYADEHTDFNLEAFGELVRGTDILFAWHSVGQKKRLVDTEDIAERAIQFFRMAKRIAPLQTGEYPVIFTPTGLVAILFSLLLGVDGKNVYLGESPLRDKLGQPVADPRFSLVDDPLIDYGPLSSTFDDEGISRRVTPIVEKGVLRNFFYDLDTAGRAGAAPTGHGAQRKPTNLVIDAGDTPHAEMLKGIKQGLLVHDYIGLGQGNPINGEFSANVFLGFKIEHGEIVGRVKDVMLAGNVYDALHDITAISQERVWVSGPDAIFPGLMPYIQVNKLSVVAK